MGCLEHTNLNIDANSLLDKASFLVEFSGFGPLFHLLTYTSDFNDQVLISEFLCNLHATRHTSHLDSRTGNTSVALSVVLFYVDTLVTNFRGWVHISTLVKLLSLSSIALIFNLGSQFSADELFTLWSNLLCELESSKPVLKIHSHVKG